MTTDRAQQIIHIKSELAYLYTEQGAHTWMTARHDQWGGLTVEEMLDADREDEVLQLLDQLISGAY